MLTAINNCILSTDWSLTRSVIFRQTLHMDSAYERVTLSDIKEDRVMVCRDGMVVIQLFVALRKFTLPI